MSGSTSSKGLAKGGRRLIRLVNSRPTPSNTTPSASTSPNPTPSTTSNPNRTYPLHNSHDSPFSSPRIQTSVFSSEESPQLDVNACRSISSTIQLENPPHLDSSIEVNNTRRGKTQIWPDGKGLFCPEFHGKVVRKITEIYGGKYDVAYPSWWKIPQSVRDMWFNELKKYYWWEEHHEVEIRQCFEFHGSETLKDTFKEVRKKPERHSQWLDEAIWKELWAYWNSDTFKKKSDAPKVNRASTTGVGSSVHIGGSIPINMHKKKMIDVGETPTVSKLYLRIHQTKGSQWVDDKSKAAYEKYVQMLSETPVNQSTEATFDGSTPLTPSEPSYDEQMKIWIDANSLTKRDRLCGFGPEEDIYTNSQGPRSIQNRGLRCQECGRNAKVFGSSLFPLPRTPEKVNAGGAWRSLFFSRFSTAAEISKEVSHEIDLLSFARSFFDLAEGPCHCWLNRSEQCKEVWKKDEPILLLAEAFLEYHRGSQVDRSSMLEKVKLLQQRYPWLRVYGLQSSSSIGSAADLNHLMHVIMEEYISFPILYCSKTFPEIADGACCFLLKDIRDPPLYHDKDVDLNSLHVALKDLKKQLDKKAGDADKLKSTWAKQPAGSNEPLICSSLQNMLLYNPACISADEDGDRLFLSDSNHHRVIVFDSSGNILAVIGSSPGFEDGDFETAKLMRPAASYYHASEDCLYFVDSENHAIRRADMSTRLVETLYPGDNDKERSGLWTWILGKLGLRRNMRMKSVEFDSEPLLFPWHLLKSDDNDLLVMNRRLDTMWTINLDRRVIHDVITGHSNIMERYGQKIMEKVSCLKDLSRNFLQKLVGTNYSLDGFPYSGLMSSFVILGNKLILCDRVGQRVLMLDKLTEVTSSIKFSNFGILGLPYWLSGSLERGFPTGNVYGEHLFDHVQSFRLFPGRIDIHLAIDIPHNTELLEPLHECCVWRQVRGAAMEFSGLESTASASEKIGVAQQWYDELDNLPFEEEPGSNVSTEEKSTSRRNLEDGKVHIYCVVNASPGTSEVIISAPLYLKLRCAFENCEETQETKAAQLAKILKADRTGRVSRDAFISFLLNLDRDLGDLVFIKPLHVKVKFNILNHPKADNSRDIILTDSSIDVNLLLD